MTSKNSFFDGRLLLDTARRQLWLGVLSLLAFFFALPLPMAMVLQHSLQNTRALAEMGRPTLPEEITATLEANASALLGTNNIFMKMAVVVLAVIGAVAVFSYLHSRQKTDFYHSLPMSRTKLFCNQFLAGCLLVIPSYLIMWCLAAALAAALGAGGMVLTGLSMSAMAGHLTFFLTIYALAVLCTILCGNTVVSLLLFGWAAFSGSGALALLETMKSYAYETYLHGESGVLTLMTRLSPVLQYFLASNPYRQFGYSFAYRRTEGIGGLGVLYVMYLAVAVALIALALFLFRRRGSEQAGGAIAFRPFQAPLKFWCVTIMALCTGILMDAVMDNAFWMYFGFALGGVLTHFLMEMIYALDFHAIFRHLKSLGVYAVLFIAVYTAMQLDVFGYDRYLPARDQIAAASINLYGNDDAPGRFTVFQDTWDGDSLSGWKRLPMETPENLDAVWRIVELGVSQVGVQWDDESLEDAEPYQEIMLQVELTQTNGRHFYRQYWIRYDDASRIDPLLEQICFSPEYVEKYSPINRIALQTPTRLEVQDGLFDKTLGATQKQEEVVAIVEALRREQLALTPAQANAAHPVMTLSLYLQSEDPDKNWNRQGNFAYTTQLRHIAVYPSYTETLALLAQYTGASPGARPHIDEVERIELELRASEQALARYAAPAADALPDAVAETSNSYTASVTAPEDLEALLENAFSYAVQYSGEGSRKWANTLFDSFDFSVQVVMRDGSSTALLYPEGQAPEALFEQYFPAILQKAA